MCVTPYIGNRWRGDFQAIKGKLFAICEGTSLIEKRSHAFAIWRLITKWRWETQKQKPVREMESCIWHSSCTRFPTLDARGFYKEHERWFKNPCVWTAHQSRNMLCWSMTFHFREKTKIPALLSKSYLLFASLSKTKKILVKLGLEEAKWSIWNLL